MCNSIYRKSTSRRACEPALSVRKSWKAFPVCKKGKKADPPTRRPAFFSESRDAAGGF
jgi:hypothetical protein